MMTFNPGSASILQRLHSENGINRYEAASQLAHSHILSSYLLSRDPYSFRFHLASNGFERDIDAQPTVNKGPNTFDPPENPNANSNKRILIVDDDADIAKFFKLALERAGFITEVSNNPVSTLNNYKKGTYDLLLLDINMPQMTGFELYKKISKIESEVKVCFITAYEEYYSEFRSEFPNLNELECYIKKPVGMDYLINAVKSRLDTD
jgi:CheY-like chemotaxis protein